MTFKVVTASHTSDAAKTELPHQGTSSSRWSLAKPTRAADNRLRVSLGNGVIWGLGYVNVNPTFDAQASSDMDTCSLSAPDRQRRVRRRRARTADARPQQRSRQRQARVRFTGQHATLGNPYFGTGCNTSVSGEPRGEITSLKCVEPSLFRKRAFSLKLTGSTMEGGIAYRWATVFKFKRVR